ncbi:hypothetical protein ACFXKC_27865 [Streptomyces sp. NPDC059340]
MNASEGIRSAGPLVCWSLLRRGPPADIAFTDDDQLEPAPIDG